jgi:hypothetical protein
VTYDQMVEHEGGYVLTLGHGSTDVDFIPCCAHCGEWLNDEGDGAFVHPDEKAARQCWERRQR